ncbi:MAG TPA: ABC transporter ATP-binding protein [Candidatus Thermoplasmatota archaeon]|nr:ABC transporter ATP-binding protein [Candidatus Thermoplasmatota archaeon]
MDAIAASGLTKDYGGGRGILDLDLRVPEGAVFGFLGPNGAGKTTTLRLLMGFLKPDHGGAEVLGRPLTADRALLHRNVGYVPGELAFPRGERVQAYLDRCARLQGIADRSRQRELVQALDVPRQLRIRELSKGNRQKVALVQAMQHDPDLLILDEPTDGLDPVLRRQVGSLLRKHAAAGGTVFLSSHVVHEIETVCDQVAIVVGGRLRSQARVAELLADLPLRVRVAVPARARPAVLAALGRHPGTRKQDLPGGVLRIEVRGDPLPLLGDLAQAGARDAHFEDKDLEETFMGLYGPREARA